MRESRSSESVPPLSPRMTPKAAARLRKAAETSLGIGTACSRVRATDGSGEIWERVEKKVDKSGRRGRSVGLGFGGSVACSPDGTSVREAPTERNEKVHAYSRSLP